MADSFFFYDLETSGISARRDRIMQFAGQRTDEYLNPIGDPVNLTLRLSPDILPSLQAALITGLTPLDGLKNGLSEAEFSEIFNNEIAIPQTIFTGFNSIRFDDEFIRYLNYRNFYDAYSWHWKNGNSRWDLLDLARMTRSLRPEGISWPVSEEGKASNRLEHLATANHLKHHKAHDALSDTLATIELAKLLKTKQPKLFNYLLSLRQKSELIKLLKSQPVLIYTSSHYPSETLHTTLVYVLAVDEKAGSALVYDLRHAPSDFLNLPINELVPLWEYNPDRTAPRLPIKTMKLNRCPAVAPLNVLDEASIKRLDLKMDVVNKNQEVIAGHREEFVTKLKAVIKELDQSREKRLTADKRFISSDERLYDKFIDATDSQKFVIARSKAKLSHGYSIDFKDQRLNELYALYRARNYPDSLSEEEKSKWREYIFLKLFDGKDCQFERFNAELQLLSDSNKEPKTQRLISDLGKYAQTIVDEYGAH